MTIQENPPLATRHRTLLPAALGSVAAALLWVAILASGASRPLLEQPLLLLGVAVAAAAGLALLARPIDVALPMLVALVYLNLSDVLARHGFPSVLQPLIAVAAVAALVAREDTKPAAILLRPLTIWLALYGAVLYVSGSWALEPSLSDDRAASNLKAFGIYLVVGMLAVSWAHLKRAVVSLVAAAVLLSGVTVFQSVTGQYSFQLGGLARVQNAQVYEEVFRPRVAGPVGDPNFYAQLLLIAIPLAMFSGFSSRGPRERTLWFASAALITGAALLTYSRGAMLALVAMGALTAMSIRLRVRYILPLAIIAAALLAFLPSGITRRLVTVEALIPGRSTEVLPDSSMQKRKLLVSTALRMFENHPLAGVGAGNYTVNFDESAREIGSAARQYEDPGEQHFPHSLYAEIAAETGVIGLVLFGGAMAAAFVDLRRARGRLQRTDFQKRALTRGLEIALAGYLVSSIFLHSSFQRYLWLVLGLVVAASRLSDDEDVAEAA